MLERRLEKGETEDSEACGGAPRAARNSGVAKIGSKSLRERERLPSRRKSSEISEWQKSGRFYIGEEMSGFVGEFDGLVGLEQNGGDFEVEVSTFQMDLEFDENGAKCTLICKIIFRGESEAMTLMHMKCEPDRT